MALAIETPVQRRHPLPKLWLMTDERQGDALWDALANLPRGSGVIVRHYGLTPKERRVLIAKIRKIARRRDITLVVAGSAKQAAATKADGWHHRSAHAPPRNLLRTVAVHNRRELVTARRAKADLIFVSPIFATDSHPNAKSLGRIRFGLLTRDAQIAVVALGGMNARRAKSLEAIGIYGWAAIDALTPKRN